MHKEKVMHTFEVCYLDINNQKALIPVTAHDFRIMEGSVVFSSYGEAVYAFRNWNSVRRVSQREALSAPSEFAKQQVTLTKNSPLLKKPIRP